MLQQGIQLLDRFFQDDRIRTRHPRLCREMLQRDG